MKLLAIDGNSIINRAFYGIKLLTTKDGVYTNGIYGFINILNKLIESEQPDGIAVAFDLKSPTFRHKMYSEYKAGRHKTPDELLSQFPILKEWLTLAGYHCIECEGYEADDILGTFSRIAEKNDVETLIVTGDRDSFQLITPLTKIYYTKDNTIIDETELQNRYGLTPDRMRDLKALMGDASDNIPGIAGVGEKTALKLLSTYGDLDGILMHADEIKGKLGERVREGEKSARFSYWLGTIVCDAPVKESLADCEFDMQNAGDAKPRLLALELNSIANRLPDGKISCCIRRSYT